MKMQKRKEVDWKKQKLPSEESHPVTDPLEEDSKNPVNKQEKSLLKPNQIQNRV